MRDKKKRGIPTVVDRLVQQAMHQELSLLYEPLFSEYSYGFRPDRAHWTQSNKPATTSHRAKSG